MCLLLLVDEIPELVEGFKLSAGFLQSLGVSVSATFAERDSAKIHKI